MLGLEIFIELSSQISDIGNGNYGFMRALVYILMLLPRDIYQFFPMAGLLGSLMGLGLLASRSELIVMRAAGLSLVDIARIVIISASIVLFITVIFGEVIAPIAQRSAVKYKSNALSSGQTLHTSTGTWVRNQRDFIYIGSAPRYGHLKNITKYQFDQNNNLIASSFAAEADYINGAWTFNNIIQSQINKQQIVTAHYDKQHWGLNIEPRLLNIKEIDVYQKSLPQLYSYIKYLKNNDLSSVKFEFVMWQRIFQPLAALVMILLAVPFIFGPLRSATMGLRMLAGAVIGLAFYMLNQFTGPMSMIFEFPAFFAASMPTLIVASFGIYLLVRAK